MGDTMDEALDRLFFAPRSYSAWQDKPVPDALLRRLYDIVKFGPTTANSQPSRFLFVRSAEAKKRLEPAIDAVNIKKTLTAPAVAIVAYDMRFFEHLGVFYPHRPQARSWYEGKPDIERTCLRNSSLQGGYFILAARALGLDCGPMSGFNEEKVNREFFPDGRLRVNFLCALGYRAAEPEYPRFPRHEFDAACQIL